MMPDDAQLVITYQSQWNWDFGSYLMQLEIAVREVRSEKQLGHGQIFHSGIKTKPAEKMVAEVLKPMFGAKK